MIKKGIVYYEDKIGEYISKYTIFNLNLGYNFLSQDLN